MGAHAVWTKKKRKEKKEDKARFKIDMIYNREGERELREV